MVNWLLCLLLLPTLVVGIHKTYGVPPHLIPRYVEPSTGVWTCLDGSKDITWQAVNDDYCDCLDGSDEPGTSACLNGLFHCANEGHIGASIPSTRVNDGLCEPECCDGSDEAPGICRNVCKQAALDLQNKLEAERAVRKKGAKIRESYISSAQKERARLEGLIPALQSGIDSRQRELARLKDLVDRAEELSTADLQRKKESPLYQALLTHSHVLESLHELHQKVIEREKALGKILEELRNGYNPNYQDMAVLEAVRGWEFWRHKEQETATNENQGQEQDGSGSQDKEPETSAEDLLLAAEQLNEEVQALLKQDHEILLLEHDQFSIPSSPESVLFDVTAYLPDLVLPHYEMLKKALSAPLRLLGFAHVPAKLSDEAARARKAFTDAEHALRKAIEDKDRAEDDLSKLLDVKMFGRQGEWKALDGTCVENETGSFTYELCFFKGAKQRGTRLGSFSSWNPSPDVKVGSPEYYSQQVYVGGDYCWDGPSRSATVHLTCGVENALVTVEEPEKCVYRFTVTTPALCLPLGPPEKHDEL